MKILHVLGGLDRGGTETWLMHVLRNTDRERLQIDFLVHTNKECVYDEEARAFGARIIHNPDPHNLLLYGYNFMKNYRRYGTYDVVHSHVHHYSGYVLGLAKICGVPKRIAHSHTDIRNVKIDSNKKRKIYLAIMSKLIHKFATHGIAASRKAAESLFGMEWEKDQRWKLLYCGIDLSPFEESIDRQKVRNELSIPEHAYVIGHVGRFSEPKNHRFLIAVAEELRKRSNEIYFLLVGDGPLLTRIRQQVLEIGMSDKIIIAGSRSDVPKLMMGAMDLFLFPSLYEGLGLALVEAQAAGLPCVTSDVIPGDVDVIKSLIFRLSLDLPPRVWAEKILELKEYGVENQRDSSLKLLETSHFNIGNGIRALIDLYNE